MCPANRGNFRNRVERADLVVGRHDRDQCRLRADGLFDRFRRDHAVLVQLQPINLEAIIFLELSSRFADGVVLGPGSDDPVRAGAGSPGHGRAADGKVIRFGSAGGKNDLIRTTVQSRRDRLTGGFNSRLGALSVAVDGGRVPELFGEIRQHGLQHA